MVLIEQNRAGWRLAGEPRADRGGFALVLTVVLLSVGLMGLAGVLLYCYNSGVWTQRSVERSEALAAAEAAIEQVVAHMEEDFRSGGGTAVAANVSAYSGMVPSSGSVPEWAGFDFLDPQSGGAGTLVQELSAWQFGTLPGKYGGVGWWSSYRIISNVRRPTLMGDGTTNALPVEAARLQEVRLEEIPIVSFAMWYNLDLEFHPWHDWTVSGRVHSNRTNYFNPSGGGTELIFQGAVTSAGDTVLGSHAHDTSFNDSPSVGSVSFQYLVNDARAAAIPLWFEADPSLANESYDLRARVLIEPPAGVDSALVASARYYNRAALRVVVDASHPVTAPQVYVSGGGSAPAGLTNALSLVEFWEKRESKQLLGIRLDLGKLKQAYVDAGLGSSLPGIVYIADRRQPADTNTELRGVLVQNGGGLDWNMTLVTPGPLYVQGNYNVTSSPPVLAMVAADAVTLLSRDWNESETNPVADTTYNMAVMTGIVPTAPNQSSGSLMNCVRLMENWSGRVLTLSGSVSVPYRSVYAASPWRTWGVYFAPTRDFRLNADFMDSSTPRVPPGCPSFMSFVRTRSEVIQPGVVP